MAFSRFLIGYFHNSPPGLNEASASSVAATAKQRSVFMTARLGTCCSGSLSAFPPKVKHCRPRRFALNGVGMDWLTHLVWPHDKFLGIEWHLMKIIGWLGNLAFTTRFFVQWYATEKKQRVVVPVAFWYMSLFGSGCLLAYSIFKRDSVFFFAYVFAWIPYIRNLVIGYRHAQAQQTCRHCANRCSPQAKYCSACGNHLTVPEVT
jgi:lipid-A-disaccharide synthase-like uncharacterized protein